MKSPLEKEKITMPNLFEGGVMSQLLQASGDNLVQISLKHAIHGIVPAAKDTLAIQI